jgi:hypothetical protein
MSLYTVRLPIDVAQRVGNQLFARKLRFKIVLKGHRTSGTVILSATDPRAIWALRKAAKEVQP